MARGILTENGVGIKSPKVSVPYFDLKTQYSRIREEILRSLDRVCENSAFILGEEVEHFEQSFAEYCDVKHCVALNSGTSALHVALLSAGIGPGDEVITTANTFIATAEAISYTGAKPVFVDIDPLTANLDAALIENAITKCTKAIIAVHLYGRPADLSSISDVASRHHLTLIEDACQAHGARYRGKRVGGFGHAAAFSFYPGKNLGAYGEGGALTTNNDSVAIMARTLRSHGETKRYLHDRVGFNFRMDGFQGTVLNVKLKYLDGWTLRRQEFANLYRCYLVGSGVRLPKDNSTDQVAYHLFVVWTRHRDRIREELARRGVQTAVHYPRPVHLQGAYAHLGYSTGSLPHTETACAEAISMPLFPEMSETQVRYAAHALVETMAPLKEA